MARSLEHNPDRERAFTYACDGLSLSAISELMEIPRGTLGRWSREDAWRERIEELRRVNRLRLAQQLSGFLATEVVASFHTIRDIRDDPASKNMERLSAAKYLIESTATLETLIERLDKEGMIEIPADLIDATAAVRAVDELTDEELEERQRLRVLNA